MHITTYHFFTIRVCCHWQRRFTTNIRITWISIACQLDHKFSWSDQICSISHHIHCDFLLDCWVYFSNLANGNNIVNNSHPKWHILRFKHKLIWILTERIAIKMPVVYASIVNVDNLRNWISWDLSFHVLKVLPVEFCQATVYRINYGAYRSYVPPILFERRCICVIWYDHFETY